MSIKCLGITPLSRILPEEPLLMMGAGLCQFLRNGRNQWHRDQPSGDTMARVLEQVKAMAWLYFQKPGPLGGWALPALGLPRWKWPWLTWSGRRPKVLHSQWLFSNRLAEMAKRAGAEVGCSPFLRGWRQTLRGRSGY